MALLLNKLLRRKQRDTSEEQQVSLSKELRLHQLAAIGIGTTIGAGIFILIGTVAKYKTGPALPISFGVAGLAAALSALNYAELSSRLPSAGSAYHYAYTCLGEGFAWVVGWSILLEYTVSGATVARGVSPNLALFFGENLPSWLERKRIRGTDIFVDPFAGFLVVTATIVVSSGIKQSATVQLLMTCMLVLVLLFVDLSGLWAGFQTGWQGYELSNGYLPFGVNGVLGGAATLFFSYVGFDALATTAEEVKNPQRDLPLGIGIALLTCAGLYMSVAAVVVGIVPYYELNIDTPISSAFARNGLQWISKLVAVGALAAMLTTLLGCFLPQPRILMTMSRDGLLPPFFAVVHEVTSVPVNSALIIGSLATLMTVFMDVDQLSEMVSVGTLIAFTAAGVCVLVIRYAPPNTQQRSSYTVLLPEELVVKEEGQKLREDNCGTSGAKASFRQCSSPVFAISCVVLGSVLFSIFLSVSVFPRWLHLSGTAVGGVILVVGSLVLIRCKQDEGHALFGKAGGFHCPLVPLLQIISVFVNVYLLLNVGPATWIRVSAWLALGVLLYSFYGIHHSVHGDGGL